MHLWPLKRRSGCATLPKGFADEAKHVIRTNIMLKGSFARWKGPLGSAANFLYAVALPNGTTFLDACRSKSSRPKGPENDEIIRLMFNAVVALDSATDYLWSEQRDEHGEQMPLQDFFSRLSDVEPAIKELRDVANALKHCIRGATKGGSFKKK